MLLDKKYSYYFELLEAQNLKQQKLEKLYLKRTEVIDKFINERKILGTGKSIENVFKNESSLFH
ncbi:hypothetical protein IMX26_08820 [Clostridium sp. 'deep sea']|uniref:hypothetical protein n=1 Tax=Clostridium sp. 'deep sea' TaxID=2779445 RepID=UPI00189660E6|nr:hypothetical protein [Clostridium sp. 'deep sea']QOR33611.1 hypothetical protein IMX26_08820 [Clostridium sp. 'deep sea']